MTHTYISVDIEADGPIPGDNSMLSLGAVAFTEGGEEFASFEANLEQLPNATPHEATMKWWLTQHQAWEQCRSSLQPPLQVMKNFHDWLRNLPGRPTFVGYPASYDFMFVYWYLMHFVGSSPFGFQALDLKSYASAVLSKPFREVTKRTMPKEWFHGLGKHTHRSVEDAREQGKLFFAMKRHSFQQ